MRSAWVLLLVAGWAIPASGYRPFFFVTGLNAFWKT